MTFAKTAGIFRNFIGVLISVLFIYFFVGNLQMYAENVDIFQGLGPLWKDKS
jgi:hypothetical protein